jgi:hypothetical protein
MGRPNDPRALDQGGTGTMTPLSRGRSGCSLPASIKDAPPRLPLLIGTDPTPVDRLDLASRSPLRRRVSQAWTYGHELS